MFSGYDPVAYKLSIWTLSAVMCAVAGALYVPQVGIINPSEMSPAASIEMAIWAAVGGRRCLFGTLSFWVLLGGLGSGSCSHCSGGRLRQPSFLLRVRDCVASAVWILF
jgi:urea transport system permease protein